MTTERTGRTAGHQAGIGGFPRAVTVRVPRRQGRRSDEKRYFSVFDMPPELPHIMPDVITASAPSPACDHPDGGMAAALPHIACPPGAAEFRAGITPDEAATFERALGAWSDYAYGQAYRTLGNATDAEDVVQEVFLALARTGRRIDGSQEFALWFRRQVEFTCLHLRRRERRRLRRERTTLSLSARVQTATDDAPAIRAAIARLPPSDQQIIELRYLANRPLPELSDLLGRHEQAIVQRLSRARRRLRRLLERDGILIADRHGPAPVRRGIRGRAATGPIAMPPPLLKAAPPSNQGIQS